jgi:hypothetical protein
MENLFTAKTQRRKGNAEKTKRIMSKSGRIPIASPSRYIAVAQQSTPFSFSPQIVFLSFAFPLRLCASAVKVYFATW